MTAEQLPLFGASPTVSAEPRGFIPPTPEESARVGALLVRLAAGETISADEQLAMPPRIYALLHVAVDVQRMERGEQALTQPPLVLSKALAHVLHAAPKNGRVHLYCDGERVSLFAEDGHRAALYGATAPEGWPTFTRAVSVADAKRLAKLGPAAGDWLPWTEVAPWSSTYPELTRDRSKRWAWGQIVDCAADVAWLREVVREKYEAVYVDVRADHEIALSTADHGHEAQPEGIVIGCAVDARYLLDAIEACPTPYAWVHFERRHLAPLRVTSARHDWSAMVMPRRSCATNSARDIVPRDPDCPCRDCTTERADRAERAKLWLPGLHHGPRAPGEAVPRG